MVRPPRRSATCTIVLALVTSCGRVGFEQQTPDAPGDGGGQLAACAETPALGPVFFVATTGDDITGNGSPTAPWRTINHAVATVPDPATVLVKPGIYVESILLQRELAVGLVLRSEQRYGAILRNADRVLQCYTCARVTIDGFDIEHDPGTTDTFQLVHIQDLSSDPSDVRDIVLRNNVFHDKLSQALVRINNRGKRVTLEHNVFYNQGDNSQQLHLNQATDIEVRDNLFFNDLAAAGRSVAASTATEMVFLQGTTGRSSNITIRRNVFVNWEGLNGRGMVRFSDSDTVLAENNLFVGTSPQPSGGPVQISNSTLVTFRNNTIVGAFPEGVYGIMLAGTAAQQVGAYNNLWTDQSGGVVSLFETPAGDTSAVTLSTNLYWNGAQAIPDDSATSSFTYLDDPARVVADPLLASPGPITLPRLVGGVFTDGSRSACEAIERIATSVAAIPPNSAAARAADPTRAPSDDILRRQRLQPSIGAWEP